MPAPLEINPGDKFKYFTVIEEVDRYVSPSGNTTRRQFICKCVCGTVKILHLNTLKNSEQVSCGCYNSKIHKARHKISSEKSGLHHSLYDTWENMNRRCYDKTNPQYPNYGGRGVRVCRKWRQIKGWQELYEYNKPFWAFVKWAEANGWTEGCNLEIDRRDNNKLRRGYSPENCRWVTSKTNNRNRRNNHYVIYNGERILGIEAWNKYGNKDENNYYAFVSRIKLGWSAEDAIHQPVQNIGKNKAGKRIKYKGVVYHIHDLIDKFQSKLSETTIIKRIDKGWKIKAAFTYPVRAKNPALTQSNMPA